ncbi:hypothetical protein K1718_10355 [Roseibium porphyridii]|uniref:Uncharacterized protein n=1 Tax=Roseibium porphyridii TaxID=2866279 RepID=A0ABY8F8G9_9HYPH|nr:hypothetical protein [Roseibium sp. KMA01]WFE91736.1 hypothetical protein K1718_10355 [Roseibium sp. KMA01]
MRLALLLSSLFFSSAAMAIMDPGPPPWNCSPRAVCNGDNVCLTVFGPPMDFVLHKVEFEENSFVLEGMHGDERLAAIFSSIEDAQFFVETNHSDNRSPIILIPDDTVSDAHGFYVYSIGSRGSGERFVSEEKLRVVCSRMPKR